MNGPRKVGRPTKLTPDLQGRILTHLATGHTTRAAAGLCGVSESTVHRWKQEHPAFSAAIDRARRIADETATDIPVQPRPLGNLAREVIRQHPDGTLEIERHYTPTPPTPAPVAAPQPPTRDAADRERILTTLRASPRGLPRTRLDHIGGSPRRTQTLLHHLELLDLVTRHGRSTATTWHATRKDTL
ncbi:helix-turn-helix domain-containing protein (plasmid) [Streptosporangium sandarakinum]|uniref:helix-turn-helix domain-containing protein n=1 Tax=Streptosporangium sandarakinum TaxID=1260955 RepID=UPI003D8CAB0F